MRTARPREASRASMEHWLIVGLGNPGPRYEPTRHNLGARVVAALREKVHLPAFRRIEKLHARVSQRDAVLAIPTTSMNNSGRAVAALLKKYRLTHDRLLVVHDDKDLAFGKFKLQQGRSSAGHRGVQSIIAALQANAFWRLRIGVGSPPASLSTDAFVLETFMPEEERQLADTIIPDALQVLAKIVD